MTWHTGKTQVIKFVNMPKTAVLELFSELPLHTAGDCLELVIRPADYATERPVFLQLVAGQVGNAIGMPSCQGSEGVSQTAVYSGGGEAFTAAASLTMHSVHGTQLVLRVVSCDYVDYVALESRYSASMFAAQPAMIMPAVLTSTQVPCHFPTPPPSTCGLLLPCRISMALSWHRLC
jgi:hypothetical protein